MGERQFITLEGRRGGICKIIEYDDGEIAVYVEDHNGHHAVIDVTGYGFDLIIKHHHKLLQAASPFRKGDYHGV